MQIKIRIKQKTFRKLESWPQDSHLYALAHANNAVGKITERDPCRVPDPYIYKIHECKKVFENCL